MNLADIAPRLARARDQHKRRRKALLAQRLRLERVVAHRELQLQRANARGNGRYIDKRQAKLKAARHALDSIRREAA